MTWRIGKNYSRTCPVCIIDIGIPQACLNYLEETSQFLISDTVWAIYETQCVGLTPISPVNWYKKNSTGTWDLYYSWTPSQAYKTALEAYFNPSLDGCYKVEYAGNIREFTVGSGCGAVCNSVPLVSTVQIYIAGTGLENASILVNGSPAGSSITVPAGTNVTFEALTSGNTMFDKWMSADGVISKLNPFTVPVNCDGSITGYFSLTVDTSGYTCADNCQNKISSGAPYKTQTECMASSCYIPSITVSNLNVVDMGNNKISVQWDQNLAGIVTITINSTPYTVTGIQGSQFRNYTGIPYGTVNVCIKGSNTVCKTINTQPPVNNYGCVNGVCMPGAGTLPAGCNNTCQPSTTGTISCQTTPVGAYVKIDNVLQTYVTPIDYTNVSSGNHTVTFSKVGYQDCTKIVNVIAGQTVIASCSLTLISCTNPKYKCVNNQCVPDKCDGTGTFTESTCGGTCLSITQKCVPLADEMYIPGLNICVKKIYAYAVGGFVALIILKK